MNTPLPDLSKNTYNGSPNFAPNTPLPFPSGSPHFNYGGYNGYMPFGMPIPTQSQSSPPVSPPPLPYVPPLDPISQANLDRGVQRMPTNTPPPVLSDVTPIQTPKMPNIEAPPQQQMQSVPYALPHQPVDAGEPSLGEIIAGARFTGLDPRIVAMDSIYRNSMYQQHYADLLGQGLPQPVAQSRAVEMTVNSNPALQALYRNSAYDTQNRSLDANYNQNALNWSMPLGDPSVYSNAVNNDPLTTSPFQGAYRNPNGSIELQAGNNMYDAGNSWRSLAGSQALGASSVFNDAIRFAQQQALAKIQAQTREYQANMNARVKRDQANIITLGRILSSVSKNLPEESKKMFNSIMAEYANQSRGNQTPNPMTQTPNPDANQTPLPNFGEPY